MTRRSAEMVKMLEADARKSERRRARVKAITASVSHEEREDWIPGPGEMAAMTDDGCAWVGRTGREDDCD